MTALLSLRIAIVSTRELLPAEREAVNFVLSQLYRKIPTLCVVTVDELRERDDDGEPFLDITASPSGDDGQLR